VAAGSAVFISDDGGVSWTGVANLPYSMSWHAASSADASILVIVPSDSSIPIYTSADSGVIWETNSAPNVEYWAVASSADGSKLVAVGHPGGIYTSQSIPTPQLNLTTLSSNVALSWIVPSTNFILQQNSDLCASNWTAVTNRPMLNFTNLQNQISLPVPASNVFYRLKTP
jgi:hypothetical protein